MNLDFSCQTRNLSPLRMHRSIIVTKCPLFHHITLKYHPDLAKPEAVTNSLYRAIIFVKTYHLYRCRINSSFCNRIAITLITCATLCYLALLAEAYYKFSKYKCTEKIGITEKKVGNKGGGLHLQGKIWGEGGGAFLLTNT